jgi:ribosomal protein L11 methyltransferase
VTRSSAHEVAFACIEVRARDAEGAERAVAEALDAGASGLEERDEADGSTRLLLYAPASRAEQVARAVARACGATVSVSEPAPVPDTDWSEAWKAGIEAVVVSPRLRIRPSFVAPDRDFTGAELVIDPGQAFGTGGHASTRLALEWIDAAAPGLSPGARVLDVGTGSGVLALAALRLGAARGVGFDLDPLSSAAARENALRNGLAARLDLFTGPIEALAPGARFELVVANLLRSELLPLVTALAHHTAPGGRAVVSGLLAADVEPVGRALAGAGLRPAGERRSEDASRACWAALLTER